MSESYVRVYYSTIDDDKFRGMSLECRGAWQLLLLAADAVWPASAYLPGTNVIPRRLVADLMEREIIDVAGDGRFRIRGLDAERERRRAAARESALQRGNAKRTLSERSATEFSDQNVSRAEPSKAEPSSSQRSASDRSRDPMREYEQITGRYPSPVTQQILDEATGLFGSEGRTVDELYVQAQLRPDWSKLAGNVKNVALREERERRKAEEADEKRRNAAKRTPMRVMPHPDYDEISDEEAERQAEELLRRPAS